MPEVKGNKPRTPESISAEAGVKWLNSKVDEVPDANVLADMCDLQAGDDSLAVVKECIPIAEAVEYVIKCRRKEAERVLAGLPDPLLGEITMEDCRKRMKAIAGARARAR